jgi:uncharacterized protein involved in exopolysaccharide biosynthesis
MTDRTAHPDRRGLSTRDVLTVLFKHQRAIAVIFVAVVAAVSLTMAPVYEAGAALLVKFGREYVYRPELGEQRPLISVTPEEVLNSEVEIFISEDLVQEAVRRIGVERLHPRRFAFLPAPTPALADAVASFRKQLRVEAVRRSSVLQVSFQHRDPRLAAEAVNLLLDLYRDKHLQMFGDEKTEFLQAQLATHHERLRQSQLRLEAFREAHGAFSYTEQMTALLRRRAELETAEQDARLQLVESRQNSGALRRELGTTHPPDVSTGIARERIRASADATTQESRIAGVAGVLAEIDARIKELDGSQVELQDIQRELAENERNYRAYQAKLEETRVASALNQQKLSNISVIHAASVPSTPIRPRKAVNLAVGALLGLLTGLGWAFGAEHLRQGVSTPERVEQRLRLPVLATTGEAAEPPPPDNVSPLPVVVREGAPPCGPALPLEREMLLLHQGLEAALRAGSGRVIQFAGTAGGDGAGEIVQAFARVVTARLGRSVLVLRASAPEPEAAAPGPVAGPLPVLPFTPPSFTLPAVFDAATVERLFAGVRQRFDLVLVDAGPALDPGGLALAGNADGVVLVVDAGRTRWPVAMKAREAIEGGGGSVLGVVLSKRRFYIPDAIYRRL